MDFYKRILVAIFPFDRLRTLSSRTGEKAKACLFVAKYDQAIILWVNTAFHIRTIVAEKSPRVKGCASVPKHNEYAMMERKRE